MCVRVIKSEPSIFEGWVKQQSIEVATTVKEAWEILEKCHAGAEKLTKVKLQTMRR